MKVVGLGIDEVTELADASIYLTNSLVNSRKSFKLESGATISFSSKNSLS